MKTNILLWAGLMLSSLSMSALASNSDIDISRSCIKKNPLVSGENDPVLLKTYSQICDKKNAENKNGYLVQAAQRFQQIGQSAKALVLVQQLEAEKVQGNTLTDIANDALKQMRQKEMRYLSSDITYPAANELIRSINSAKPASVLLETALNTAEKNQATSKSSKTKSAKVSAAAKTKAKTRPVATTTAKPKTSTTTVKVNTTNSNTNSSSNPFAGL